MPGFKGQTTAPKSVVADTINQASTTAKEPNLVADRWAYGIITDINDRQQVKVQLYQRRDSKGNEQQILGGKYIPLATQLSDIHLKYGALRKGLQVLVHWRGNLRAKWAIAHIIGDEELNILEQEPLDNDIAGPPISFLSGGMTDF